MSLQMQIINPLEFKGWDDLVLSSNGYSFFHSAAWARVLNESYKYKPLYFTVIESNRLSVLIPMMEVNSIVTGKRGVSLPFSDYCEIICGEEFSSEELVGNIIRYGRKERWKYVEFRPGKALNGGLTASTSYFGHRMSLLKNEKNIFSKFRDSTKRNIKKASREGVRCFVSNSWQSVKDFYVLNKMTRKQHGIPPQPLSFFKKIYEHIISDNKGVVVLAYCNGRAIAGSMYFHFGRRAIYKYGASDKQYQHLRPNNLVMWNAIKMYCQNGYQYLDMGRTEKENKGLNQFKNGWNTTIMKLSYYKYSFKKKSFVENNSDAASLSEKIVPYIPDFMSRIIGSIAYKHIG